MMNMIIQKSEKFAMEKIAAHQWKNKRAAVFCILPVLLFGLLGASNAGGAEFSPASALSQPRSQADTPVILPGPDARVREMGRELLKLYRLPEDKAIRFSYQGYIYESSGCRVISSLEEARTRYPDYPIPEVLGDYRFQDLTLCPDRTKVLSSGSLDAVRILESRPPDTYWLCYTDGESRFRIQLLPCWDAEERENWDCFSSHFAVWPLYPEVHWEESGEDGAAFSSLAIPPGPGESYGYFVLKLGELWDLEGGQRSEEFDCLESSNSPFTEQEAVSIYQGIREGFAAC